jgi:hypothetical protein
LPPDVSCYDNVIGDENIAEYDDDEEEAQNEMVLTQAPPVEVAPVAHGNGVLAPLPQNISGITATRKREALKSKSDNILYVYKLKILQKDEERGAEHESEERASKMRMYCKEEERHFRQRLFMK